MMAPDSIGSALEQRRLEYRAARLRAALSRLDRIATDARASGRTVPPALRSAEQTFTEELATATAALRQYETSALRARAEGA